MNTKKILVVGNFNSIHLQNWIKYFFQNKRFKLNYLSYEKTNFKIPDCKLKSLNRKKNSIFSIFLNFFLIANFLYKDKPKMVVIHYINEQLINFWLLKIFFKYKLTIIPWGSDLNFNINIFQKFIKRLLISKSDLIITDGYHIKHKLLNFFKINHNNIKISNFGIDLKKINNLSNSQNIDNFLSDRNIQKFIVSNRSLEDLYSIDTLIYAFKQLSKSIQDIHLIIIGDGSKKDQLIELSKSLNIENKVIFIGKIDHEELLIWVKKSSIYISTSLYDAGLSSSIAEAIFLKKKIICADNSDNNFWMQKYNLGLTFENKNFNDLNNKIYSMLNFKVNKDSIDISFFEKKFDYDSVMIDIDSYLSKTLKNDC